MDYRCCHTNQKGKRTYWVGKIENLQLHEKGYEAEVCGRGSNFYIIVGESNRGNYLCIPTWKVGCELAGYRDYYWNREKIELQIGTVDAVTVATAIKEIGYLLESVVD